MTFARCGEESKEISFKSFDELVSTKTIDGLLIIKEWKHVKDFIIDSSFSLLEDGTEIQERYGLDLTIS